MTQQMKAKREELKALSNSMKQLLQDGAIQTINEGLTGMYAEQGHTTLKSYKGWLYEGYQVKKGSKALLLWGVPVEIKNKNTENLQQEEEADNKYFPLAYVFSNQQVEPIRKAG